MTVMYVCTSWNFLCVDWNNCLCSVASLSWLTCGSAPGIVSSPCDRTSKFIVWFPLVVLNCSPKHKRVSPFFAVAVGENPKSLMWLLALPKL